MIAVDTNVLVYAVNTADPRHDRCRTFLTEAVASSRLVVPWAVIYEFLRVGTHPKVMREPLSIQQAWSFVAALIGHPNVVVVAEGVRHAEVVEQALQAQGVYGNLVCDARIAAVLTESGVRDLVTYDQDFHRFKELRVRSP